MQDSNEIRAVSAPDEIAEAKETRQKKLLHLGLIEFSPDCGKIFEDEYIRVFRDPVKFPSGKFGTFLRIEECAIQNGIAGIVVVPKLGENIFLQRIFRYPTHSWEWEFPRGFLEPGHSPKEMVHRELAEETGLTVDTVEEVGFLFSNTGLLSGGAKVFVVQVKHNAGKPTPEDGEVIGELLAVSPAKLWAMARSGEIRDAFTLSAMSLALSKQLILPAPI